MAATSSAVPHSAQVGPVRVPIGQGRRLRRRDPNVTQWGVSEPGFQVAKEVGGWVPPVRVQASPPKGGAPEDSHRTAVEPRCPRGSRCRQVDTLWGWDRERNGGVCGDPHWGLGGRRKDLPKPLGPGLTLRRRELRSRGARGHGRGRARRLCMSVSVRAAAGVRELPAGRGSVGTCRGVCVAAECGTWVCTRLCMHACVSTFTHGSQFMHVSADPHLTPQGPHLMATSLSWWHQRNRMLPAIRASAMYHYSGETEAQREEQFV